MLCGYTVGEYVRMRRLSIAGEELLSSDVKVIDIAMKYGYDSDEEMAGNEFRYMIADDYGAGQAEAKKLDVHEIKEHTWAVFPCRGPMPLPLQEANCRIFSEWLPASSYEIAEGYNIEYYSNPEDFKMGMQDHEYYAEVWIPVKEK